MSAMSRRGFLESGTQALSLVALASTSSALAAAAGSCVKTESDSLRHSLEYVDPAPDERQTCAQCGFFTAEKAPPCGSCAIINGPVSAKAHCHSFSDKNE